MKLSLMLLSCELSRALVLEVMNVAKQLRGENAKLIFQNSQKNRSLPIPKAKIVEKRVAVKLLQENI